MGAADVYARARPSYPAEVFADVAELAELRPGARLVEIGCGTGQATRPLAERGYAITCLEPDREAAALARRHLAGFPDVEVVEAAFEAWRPPHGAHDAVVAFSSFHRIAPERRYRIAAELLGPSGKLVVVSVVHVLPECGDPFFLDIADDYVAVLGEEAREMLTIGRPPHPDAIAELSDRVVGAELAASGALRLTGTRRYFWDVAYSRDGYIDLLTTVSTYRRLEPAPRERLFGRLRQRIGARPGSRVRVTYMALLYVAERI